MVRLYYNKRCSLPWSVDNGDQSTEQEFAGVQIEAQGRTCEGESDDPENQPCAWIEFPDAEFIVEGDRVIIVEGV